MCPDTSEKTNSHIISYSLPRLHTGKTWYVDFRALDPVRGEWRRKKYHLDGIAKKSDRRQRAAELISALTEKLQSGWLPWCEIENSRAYTLLEDVIGRYSEYIRKSGRKKTFNSYSSRLNVLKEYMQTLVRPPLYAYQFDKAFVSGFLDYIYLDRDAGARTRNNYRGWCSSFAEFMVSRKYIDVNPVKEIPSLKEDPKRRQGIPKEELKKMRRHLKACDPHFLLACMMEYYTFIRPSELSQLRIGDILLREQKVFVAAEISKNRRDGTVGLCDELAKMMIDLGVLSFPSDYYLFSKDFKPGTRRMGPDIFNKRWAKMRKALKWGAEYQFYSLKDSGIRDLANSEGIVIARDQARHTDIATTNRYLSGREMKVAEETKHFRGALADDGD